MTAIDPSVTTNPYAGVSAPQIDRPDQMGKDTFLKLLVAQLQYQNPMQPTDPSTFMAQSAQFSMMEAMQNMATQLQAGSTANQVTMASALIGKQVTFDNNGTPTQAVVASVKLDSSGANPPTLHLSTGDDIPLASVTTVQGATTTNGK
jgi:flagellar basal-body rod modification protein FlgD